MKDLKTLLEQTPVFLNDWSGVDSLVRDFEDEGVKNYNVLFASYSYANYSGDAFVLLEKDGELYEVNGGHCSCYGLEGQFSPEKTDLKAIQYRLENGSMGSDDWCGNQYGSELKEFLGI